MFESIVDNPKYNVTVLSRPIDDSIDEDEDKENDSFINIKQTNIKNGPWVILIDNFINDIETKRFIELGAYNGYERSEDVGSILSDGSLSSIISKSEIL